MEEEMMKYYKNLTYAEAKGILQEKLMNIKMNFIAAGYYLKYIRDKELYLEEGYASIWEFAEDNYGIQRSTASRWMKMNDKFSKNGDTPILAEEYKEFGKSQLQEMLYLEDEQMEQVTPDMTVKEIREVRKPDPEDVPVSILGYPLRTYPEDSLITTPGCGKQDCFSCHRDGCGIRQAECWCVEAPCGNPFPCTTIGIVPNLREEIGEGCQFVNHDLAYHRTGDGEPVPCCKKCTVQCELACDRAIRASAGLKKDGEKNMCDVAHDERQPEEQMPGQMAMEDFPEFLPEDNTDVDNDNNNVVEEPAEQVLDAEYRDIPAEGTESEEAYCREVTDLDGMVFSEIAIRDYLEDEEKTLAEYIECNNLEKGFPVRLLLRQKMLVKALRLLMENETAQKQEDDETEGLELVQPELPALKNYEQRKEWLNNYKEWPVWFTVPEAAEVYYRFNLPDGSSIVVCEYHMWIEWKERYSDENPDSIGTREYLLKPGYKYLQDCRTSSTALAEHLKNLQKGGKNSTRRNKSGENK
ncbi:hypothetical protein LI221_05555 [Faecalimonas umbilicata]|nr:hypothetical protein [Faecalimonas umbilicata]